jgi:hypothetical protein
MKTLTYVRGSSALWEWMHSRLPSALIALRSSEAPGFSRRRIGTGLKWFACVRPIGVYRGGRCPQHSLTLYVVPLSAAAFGALRELSCRGALRKSLTNVRRLPSALGVDAFALTAGFDSSSIDGQVTESNGLLMSNRSARIPWRSLPTALPHGGGLCGRRTLSRPVGPLTSCAVPFGF